MTKKDYTLIGKVLYRARQLVIKQDETEEKDTIDWITEKFCIAFKDENSKFDSDKFKQLVQKEDK